MFLVNDQQKQNDIFYRQTAATSIYIKPYHLQFCFQGILDLMGRCVTKGILFSVNISEKQTGGLNVYKPPRKRLQYLGSDSIKEV